MNENEIKVGKALAVITGIVCLFYGVETKDIMLVLLLYISDATMTIKE